MAYGTVEPPKRSNRETAKQIVGCMAILAVLGASGVALDASFKFLKSDAVSDSYELSSAPPDPIKVVSGRECATVGANLGPGFKSPGECLAAGRSECGNIIMWSEAYPSWGCHCCAPGKGVGGRENRHWDLYRGIFSPKKRFDELETAVHAWASKKAAAKKEYGPISTWDVSAITDMSGLFYDTSFDDDISDWDVSRVTNMRSMFHGASAFNQPLNAWDVSRVKYMQGMFQIAESFNQPLNDWAVASVRQDEVGMKDMFTEAYEFDQNLGWCVTTRMISSLRDENTFSYTKCHSNLCGVKLRDQGLSDDCA